MEKKRDSNFELLRIVAMLMIIANHICSHCVNDLVNDVSNPLFMQPFFYKRLSILWIISCFGQTGNAIFFLIAGYYMTQKEKIDLTHIAKKLLLQLGYATIVLTIGSTIVDKFFIKNSATLIRINAFNEMAWFVGYYFVVIIIAKLFLNSFLIKRSKKEYIEILVTVFALTQFSWSNALINSLANGLITVFTGLFLYALGGYIQKYNPLIKIRVLTLILMFIVIFLLILQSNYNNTLNNIKIFSGNGLFTQSIYGFSTTTFVPVILGIIVFELFKRIRVPQSKIINFFGSATFMVYLLHDNEFVYSIWKTQDWISILYCNPYYYIWEHFSWTILTFIGCFIFYVLYFLLCKIMPKINFLFVKD